MRLRRAHIGAMGLGMLGSILVALIYHQAGRTPALVGTATLLVLVLAVYLLPPALIPSAAQLQDADRVRAVAEARTALVQAVGGAALVGTLYFTAVSLQDSRDNTNRTLELNRQGQVADRFTRAVTQLGDAALDVRVGGIYGLEQIARDAEEDRAPIYEILTTYLHEHDPWVPSAAAAPHTALHADLRAALTVLGRRRVDQERDKPLDLRDLDLRGADLTEANLDHADLRGSNLEGAHLTDAKLKFVRFEGADLHDARLGKDDPGTVGADISNSHLEGDDLSNADLNHTYLDDTVLDGANLTGVNLSEAELKHTHLRRAILSGANLKGASLDTIDVDGADLLTVVGMTRDQFRSTIGTPVRQPAVFSEG